MNPELVPQPLRVAVQLPMLMITKADKIKEIQSTLCL